MAPKSKLGAKPMALSDGTMARLTERQAAERRVVRDMTRRYDRAAAAAAAAREALAAAEAERAAVVAEWVAMTGWTAERIAEITGLAAREVAESVRAHGQRRPPAVELAALDPGGPAIVVRPPPAADAAGTPPRSRSSVA
jgi:hypothetical protein